jgi:hypothetical protein
MTFLTLDDNQECIGIYKDGKLIFDNLPKFSSERTWKITNQYDSNDILYANILCEGKDFSEVCPEHLKDTWEELNKKAKSFIRSFIESKVSLKHNCFYDLVPEKFLIQYCDIKCEIIDYIFESHEKPNDYQYKVDLERLLNKIKSNEIKFNFEKLKNHQYDQKIHDFILKYSNKQNYIYYNQFSSKTGRLTTEEKSFPILNISKSFRSAIEPENDFFLDIDYNAAEVRVFLALNGFKQPQTDIHEWNRTKFGYVDRNTAKSDFISWLYGKKNTREQDFKKYYNTDFLKKKYWNGTHVKNYYGKVIDSDEFHAINYIVQSTTAGMVLRQAIKVDKLLEGKKSKIKMIIHDNIVIDIKKEEKELIKDIIQIYNDTEFGKFKTSVKIGKNLGEMRNLL